MCINTFTNTLPALPIIFGVQERKNIDTESCVPQYAPKRDTILGEHEYDRHRRFVLISIRSMKHTISQIMYVFHGLAM